MLTPLQEGSSHGARHEPLLLASNTHVHKDNYFDDDYDQVDEEAGDDDAGVEDVGDEDEVGWQ